MALLRSHAYLLLKGTLRAPEQQPMATHNSSPCLHFVKFEHFHEDFTEKSKNLSPYP